MASTRDMLEKNDHLLQLPAELRNRVYKSVLYRQDHFCFNTRQQPSAAPYLQGPYNQRMPAPSLLLTCKAIYAETCSLYWVVNMFHMTIRLHGHDDYPSSLKGGSARYIRSLEITLRLGAYDQRRTGFIDAVQRLSSTIDRYSPALEHISISVVADGSLTSDMVERTWRCYLRFESLQILRSQPKWHVPRFEWLEEEYNKYAHYEALGLFYFGSIMTFRTPRSAPTRFLTWAVLMHRYGALRERLQSVVRTVDSNFTDRLGVKVEWTVEAYVKDKCWTADDWHVDIGSKVAEDWLFELQEK